MIYNLSGQSLSSVYDVNGEGLGAAYDINGTLVFEEGGGGTHRPISDYENYTVEMLSYTTPCGQDFAYHDGYLVAATDTNDILRVVNATTGARLGESMSVSIGHCNSLVFSNEYYDENDTFPLICTPYNGLSYYRVDNSFTSTTFIKKYSLQTTSKPSTKWYGLGFDFDEDALYVAGYTSGTYQPSSANTIMLAKYDLANPIDNGDSTYTLPLVYKKERQWFECIQGSEVHDGYMWVMSGITSPPHLYALDLNTAEILFDIDSESGGWSLEPEAVSWVNDYTLLIGTKNRGSDTGMYKVTFTDIQSEINA